MEYILMYLCHTPFCPPSLTSSHHALHRSTKARFRMLIAPSADPWYLEKVEVVLLSPTAPLCWVAHYRDWVRRAQLGATHGGDTGRSAPAPNGAVGEAPGGDVGAPSANSGSLPCVVVTPDPLAWEEWDMQVTTCKARLKATML